MSEVSVPSKPQKRESLRSVIIVAVLCGSFLWWWFSIDPAPEPVGPLKLVERALHDELQETSPTTVARPLAVDFDLLELAMGYLRGGKFQEATNLTTSVHAPILQARGLRAVAYGHLAKETGDLGASLKVLSLIADPALQQAARDQILVEITRLGFADIAWEQQPSLAVKVAIVRSMAESDAQAEAATRLTALEPAVLAQASPALLEEMLWAHLALRHVERVIALVPQLPEPKQDEIYLELFRMVRLDDPNLARPTLARLPARLQLAARLEAAKLNGTLETPDELVAELERNFKTEPTIASALLLTQAQWQLTKPEPEAWLRSAPALEQLLATAPAPTVERIHTTLTLAQIYYDALDATNGHRLLEQARVQTSTLAERAQRIEHLANLLEAAFRNAETNYVQQLLHDLQPELQAMAATADASLTSPLRKIFIAMFREGDWHDVFDLLPKFPVPMQASLLTALADLPVESSAGQGFAVAQDKSLATIRQLATSQGEGDAAKLALRQPTGLARARAWLEIAKGLVLKELIDQEAVRPQAKTE